MRQTFFTDNRGQHIVIVQGVYTSYCATSEPTETVYDLQPARTLLATDATEIASDAEWLKFQGLVEAWQRERGAMSSITMAAMCPAYQSIIGMGEVAVPLMIKQLQSEGDEPDQWFWALKAITGVDPVQDWDRGDVVAMARAWLAWAETQATFAW